MSFTTFELTNVMAIEPNRTIRVVTSRRLPKVFAFQTTYISTSALPLENRFVLFQIGEPAAELSLDNQRAVGALNDDSCCERISARWEECS